MAYGILCPCLPACAAAGTGCREELSYHNFSEGVASTESRARKRLGKCRVRGLLICSPETADTGTKSADVCGGGGGGGGKGGAVSPIGGGEFAVLQLQCHHTQMLFLQLRKILGLLIALARGGGGGGGGSGTGAFPYNP